MTSSSAAPSTGKVRPDEDLVERIMVVLNGHLAHVYYPPGSVAKHAKSLDIDFDRAVELERQARQGNTSHEVASRFRYLAKKSMFNLVLATIVESHLCEIQAEIRAIKRQTSWARIVGIVMAHIELLHRQAAMVIQLHPEAGSQPHVTPDLGILRQGLEYALKAHAAGLRANPARL